MNRPSNRDIERHYFEQFRRDHDLPDGNWHYTDRPDVILQGTLKIGIEITNLYLHGGDKPESEQVQRRRRIQVLERAQEAFLAAGGKQTELSVDFNPYCPIHQIEPLAKALASLGQQLIGQPTQQVNPLRFEHIPQLRFVYHNATEYPNAKWRLVQSFTVPSLSLDRLQVVVNEKSVKLADYEPCDCYWLLVVVDLMDSAQDQQLEWPPGNVLRDSPYEKVLVYKPQFRQVLEVPQ
jgi:hypothetical protein